MHVLPDQCLTPAHSIFLALDRCTRAYTIHLWCCLWQDIISKRKITHAEMEALNPGVDLDRLTPNQVQHDLQPVILMFSARATR